MQQSLSDCCVCACVAVHGLPLRAPHGLMGLRIVLQHGQMECVCHIIATSFFHIPAYGLSYYYKPYRCDTRQSPRLPSYGPTFFTSNGSSRSRSASCASSQLMAPSTVLFPEKCSALMPLATGNPMASSSLSRASSTTAGTTWQRGGVKRVQFIPPRGAPGSGPLHTTKGPSLHRRWVTFLHLRF